MLFSPPPERARQQLLARAMFAVWRSRITWGLVALMVTALIVGAMYISSLWDRAHSDVCEVWEPADIGIERLIQLKQRKQAYQSNPSPDAMLAMSADEVNFILEKTTPYGLDVAFDGDHVRARVTAPVSSGCYDIHFEGRLAIRDRVVEILPDHLIVGDVDLSRWVDGGRYRLTRSQLENRVDPAVLDVLDNVERVEVHDSMVHFRLYDPWGMW